MKKTIVILLVILTLVSTFSGCKKEAGDVDLSPSVNPTATVIGVANNTNSTIANPELLEKVVADACRVSGSSVSVIEIDGNAFEVSNTVIEYPSGYSKDNIQSLFRTNCLEVTNAIEECVPKSPQVDMMQGFNVLSNALKALSYGNEDMELNLIIVSNLLSTKGIINHCESTLYFDTQKYIEYLEPHMPTFEGVKSFKWIETGYCGNQEPLQNTDIEKLEEVYATLFAKAGINKIEFIPANSANNIDQSTWCEVSSVDVRQTSFTSEQTAKVDITLDSNTLFKADSVEFEDEEKAKNTLKSLVPAINAYDGKVYICGSTAFTDSDARQHVRFSKERADAVVKLLTRLDADKEKLVPIGIGKEKHPYRVPENFSGINENRCVYIVSENTPKATEFLQIASRFPSINGN